MGGRRGAPRPRSPAGRAPTRLDRRPAARARQWARWLYALNGVSILVVRQIPAHQAFRRSGPSRRSSSPRSSPGSPARSRPRDVTVASRGPGSCSRGSSPASRLLAALNALFPEHRALARRRLSTPRTCTVSRRRSSRRSRQCLLVDRARPRAREPPRLADRASPARRAARPACRTSLRRRRDRHRRRCRRARRARADFGLRGDPASKPRMLRACSAAALAGSSCTGVVDALGEPHDGRSARTRSHSRSRSSAARSSGSSFRGAYHLNGPCRGLVPGLGLSARRRGAVAFVLVEWLASVALPPAAASDDEREHAHDTRHDAGGRTRSRRSRSAPTSRISSPTIDLRSSRTGSSGGVAIVAGDPIGPCRSARGSRAALPRLRPRARLARRSPRRVRGVASISTAELGLRSLYHGDEAVVDTASFSLEGGRSARCGNRCIVCRPAIEIRVLRPCEIDAEPAAQLEEVARTWRGAAPERGCVMAIDASSARRRRHDLRRRVRPGRAAAGLPPLRASRKAGSALSLSSMPRPPGVPNGFTEWLICGSIDWARDAGSRPCLAELRAVRRAPRPEARAHARPSGGRPRPSRD